MSFSKSMGTEPTTPTTEQPFFRARMIRDAPIGALISIIIGFILLLIKTSIPSFASLNLNSWMFLAMGKIPYFEDLAGYLEAILSIPTTTDQSTPLYQLQFIYASFLSFPSNLSWLVGGAVVGYLRIRRGRDEGNAKSGWSTFWYGLISIEIPFAVFGVLFLIYSAMPLTMDVIIMQGFTGSVLLFFLLCFLQPMFWMALIMSMVGSVIGSVIAKKKGYK